MKDKIKILTCHHKQAPIYTSKYIIPIQAGKEISNVQLNMIGDNTGKNISEKNRSWCELTVIYWMWKNLDADYYGLFHYRRFLNFNAIGGGYNIFHEFDSKSISDFGWDDKIIEDICNKFDIITSPIWNIHPVGLPNKLMTNYEFYAKEHFAKDLDIVIDIIKERSPNIYPYALKSLYSKECFFANMFIMNKRYFFEYCEWIFDILFEAEKKIDISQYDSYQYRIWGFIAERLSNCFLEYIKARDKNLRYTSLGMVFGIFEKYNFSKNEFETDLLIQKKRNNSILSKETINIVFSIDDNYAKHCATAIQSILDFSNENQNIAFYILHDKNLSEECQSLLKNIENKNIEVSFIKVNEDDFKFYPLNRSHISIATYYRLAIHKLLPKHVDKIIYLDADILVLDNIANLWNEDVSEFILAGSPDEGGISQIRRLGLSISHNYINAGICIMNIDKMRLLNLDNLYAKSLYENYDLITLQDQDILNITFEKNIKRLSVKWNMQSRMFKYNELEHSYSYKEIEEAMKAPGIIHFSDHQKPWQVSSRHPLKYLFTFYENKIKDDWKLIHQKSNILNFISYEVKGDIVEIFITFKNTQKTIFIRKKIARIAFKIGKSIFKILNKMRIIK